MLREMQLAISDHAVSQDLFKDQATGRSQPSRHPSRIRSVYESRVIRPELANTAAVAAHQGALSGLRLVRAISPSQLPEWPYSLGV